MFIQNFGRFIIVCTLLMSGSVTAQSQEADEDAVAADSAAQSAEDTQREAEDKAVQDVLDEAAVIYEDDDTFTPTQEVSADQSLDYPIDI